MKTEHSILKTIAYFDLFSYPVTADEIYRFIDLSLTAAELEGPLKKMVAQKIIFQLDEFYSMRSDHLIAERRRKGNARAGELLQIAYRIGAVLYTFPFVRGVGISGSLSKNYADEDADIDFFIITKANRLWIARTLLHCLKKLSFLAGKQHWYCMNYFIDEQALVIAEKNVFTATEVVTLKPVRMNEGMAGFYSANDWTHNYFPNQKKYTRNLSKEMISPWYKKVFEKIFNTQAGNWLDDRLMKITARRWTKKEAHHQLNLKGDPVGLAINKHFARPNPGHFQKKLLMMYEDKLRGIEKGQ